MPLKRCRDNLHSTVCEEGCWHQDAGELMLSHALLYELYTAVLVHAVRFQESVLLTAACKCGVCTGATTVQCCC
jgi:hypothetical protein